MQPAAIISFPNSSPSSASPARLHDRKFSKNLTDEFQSTPPPGSIRNLGLVCGAHLLRQGDFQDPEAYKRLSQQITEVDKQHNTGGNRFFYLAVALAFSLPS